MKNGVSLHIIRAALLLLCWLMLMVVATPLHCSVCHNIVVVVGNWMEAKNIFAGSTHIKYLPTTDDAISHPPSFPGPPHHQYHQQDGKGIMLITI